MLKKILCLVLAGLLMNMLSVSVAYADSQEAKRVRFIEQVKAGIATLGAGPDAKVEVKLQDRTKLKGYLSEVTPEHFVVTDAKTGAATQVLYPQVKQVKGQNLSSGARIAIGLAITAAVLLTVLLVVGAVFEQ